MAGSTGLEPAASAVTVLCRQKHAARSNERLSDTERQCSCGFGCCSLPLAYSRVTPFDTAQHGQGCEGYDTTHDTNCPRLPGCKHSFPATPCPPLTPPPPARYPCDSDNFSLKRPSVRMPANRRTLLSYTSTGCDKAELQVSTVKMRLSTAWRRRWGLASGCLNVSVQATHLFAQRSLCGSVAGSLQGMQVRGS